MEPFGVEFENGFDVRSLSEDGVIFEIKAPKFNFFEEEMWNSLRHERDFGCKSEMKDENKTSFEIRRSQMEDISKHENESVPAMSVLKKLVAPGTGDKIPIDALVTIHYNAYLDGVATPFDSTYLQRKPKSFRFGGDVLVGLEIAAKSMKVNEKSEFLITPDFAYGKFGCLKRIPPNSHILFVVHLIECTANSVPETPEEESQSSEFQKLMKKARAIHAAGVDYERRDFRDEALPMYINAANLLVNASCANAEEKEESRSGLLKLYLNISRLSCMFGEYEKSCKFADLALQIDEKSAKAMYWRGCACIELGDWDGAMTSLIKAVQLGSDNDIVTALDKLKKKKRESLDEEKRFCQRMFNTKDVV